MIKIGVIGAGHLGKIHIQCIKQVDQLDLVGFYDNDPHIAEQVSEEYGIKHFDSIEELIEECDAIDIVSPTVAHFDAATKSLKRGKHVFIEKPIVATPQEANKLSSIAYEANVKVQVGHVERFNPAFIAAEPFINKPKYIEAHRISRYKKRGSDVPVVLDLMIHDIDIVLNVVKSNIKKITASGVTLVSSSPDLANARIEFTNGCVANLTASRIASVDMRKMRFFQNDSFVTVDFLDKKTEIIKLVESNEEPVDNGSSIMSVTKVNNKKGNFNLLIETPIVIHTNAIVEELKSFADSILNNDEPIVTIDDGNDALIVAYKILEKIENKL
ncbi:MAG: Gfo/Idh/MocA family oxidoreductase [Lentimicrobiaceae bacterium]|nr:Gfo/Idh/MocA family oxidoreductase [Lentimicrobiaceae bacterium]